MLTEEDADRVHLNLWSGVVLGFGFALGFLFAQMTVTIIGTIIFLAVWAATH